MAGGCALAAAGLPRSLSGGDCCSFEGGIEQNGCRRLRFEAASVIAGFAIVIAPLAIAIAGLGIALAVPANVIAEPARALAKAANAFAKPAITIARAAIAVARSCFAISKPKWIVRRSRGLALVTWSEYHRYSGLRPSVESNSAAAMGKVTGTAWAFSAVPSWLPLNSTLFLQSHT